MALSPWSDISLLRASLLDGARTMRHRLKNRERTVRDGSLHNVRPARKKHRWRANKKWRRNMSLWQYSPINPSNTLRLNLVRSNSPRSNSPRYGIGLALVLLLHAGAFVAFKNGLSIRDIGVDIPPLDIKVVLPPPSTPIEIAKPEPTLWKPTTGELIDKAKQIDIGITTTDEPPPIDTKPATVTKIEPVIVAAKTDPRHPLTQPVYPAQSRRAGEQGSVELLIYVLADGRVGDARIAVSSGYTRLDEAALQEALRSWRLLPNEIDGMKVASWNRIGITFRLKN
jgi:periplasmic protein TonB